MKSKSSVYCMLSLIALSHSMTAFADKLACGKKQETCVTEDKKITIGDQVGIFNSDGELVAIGDVTDMKGQKRVIKIKNNLGPINKNSRLALVNVSNADDARNQYRVYREAHDRTVGGSLGMASLHVGSNSSAYEGSGYMSFKTRFPPRLVGRALFTHASGSASIPHDPDEGIRTRTYEMNGIALLPGISYTILPQKTVSFLTEVNAGLMYVSSSISGSSASPRKQGFDLGFADGLNLMGRLSAGVAINHDKLSGWRPEFMATMSLIKEAKSVGLTAGVSHGI